MRRDILGRVIYDIFLFVGVLFFPWWFTVVLVCIGVVLYEKYYESIIAGVLIDLLYETFFIPIAFTLSFVLIYIVLSKLKKHIRIYG